MTTAPRVLVVDDSPTMLEIYVTLLRDTGWTVSDARNGAEALQRAAECPPDVVLLDVVLPDISGIEVCRRLKGQPATRDCLVALISSDETGSDRQAHGLESGADAYIARPIPHRELLARVQALVRLKQTEDALRDSQAEALRHLAAARAGEARLRALMESAPDAMIQVDESGLIAFINHQGLALFGYAHAELLGQPIEALIPARFHARHVGLRNHFLAHLTAGRAEVGRDLTARRKDGSEFDASISLSTIAGPNGFSVLAAVRDVSERRKMEETLALRTRHLNALLAAFRTMTSGLDLPEILERVLDEAVRISGTPHVKVLLLDKSTNRLQVGAIKGSSMPKDFVLPVGFGLSGVVAKTGESLFVADAQNDPRSVFSAQDRVLGIVTYLGLPIKHGGEVLGALTFNTTAPRRYSEDEVGLLTAFAEQAAIAIQNAHLYQESERQRARVAQILDSAVEGFYQTAEDGRILSANPALAQILGYESPVALMADVTDVGSQIYVDPERRAELRHLLDEAGSVANFEVELRRRDGGSVWVAVNARKVQDAAGRVRYYEGFMQDISERRHAEQLKADFVSFATHQLRTPLAGIKWLLELAVQEDGIPAEARDLVQDAQASTERLIKLVNDLLDATRLERRKIVLDLQRVDLGQLAAVVFKELQPLAEARGHTLTLDVAPGAAAARGDPQLLRQVVLNLASNAIKYTPPGGRVTVRAGADGPETPPPARPGTAPGLPRAQLSIADTGVGIPREAQSRLFEKFFRAENVLALETEGTGLGLYIVKLIVEQHGGNIVCESEEGRGSTFTVKLPADGPANDPGAVEARG
jgi:PAS domain S-box-containing protein